jgi:hypothetical protein
MGRSRARGSGRGGGDVAWVRAVHHAAEFAARRSCATSAAAPVLKQTEVVTRTRNVRAPGRCFA